jgi:hypothetical protein
MAMTKQEIAEGIKALNRRVNGPHAEPYIDQSDWEALLKFLGKALDVPDHLLYADEPAAADIDNP